ncbi:hypothetical protein L596_022895 [Steinernema carpocapsae]|uniref:Uncharacterized protein n=2 Tax=Steinernema carpocapsae TaxID=34508 RepID=A0A4U5MBW8_STECR|nr:hypothetical protein L596_022895 [Steinernema carpocapsae]
MNSVVASAILVFTLLPICSAFMSCPMGLLGGLAGGYGGMGGFGGNYCGMESFFHYYTCCDYNPMECCFQLHPWAIAALVILGILLLLCCFGCIGVAVWKYRPMSSAYSDA